MIFFQEEKIYFIQQQSHQKHLHFLYLAHFYENTHYKYSSVEHVYTVFEFIKWIIEI